MSSTVRAYSVLLSTRNNPKLTNALERTFQLYVRGGNVFANLFLDLLGSLEPVHIKTSPFATSKLILPQLNHETGNYEEEGISQPVTDQTLLFSSWFSLESADYAPEEYVCDPDQVWPQFVRYCRDSEAGGMGRVNDTSWETALKHTVNSIKSDEEGRKVWINRRQSFYDLNQKLRIPPAAITHWFNGGEFPFQEKATDAPKYARSLLSDWFGEELQKNDWNASIGRLKQLFVILDTCDTDKAFEKGANLFLKGVKVVTKGKPSTIQNMIDGKHEYVKDGKPQTEPEKIKAIGKAIENKLSHSIHKASFPYGEWTDTVQKYLENRIGVPYNQDGRCQSQFGEMACIALERLKSWKSNFFRQVGERIVLLQGPALPNTREHALLASSLRDYMETFNESRKKVPFLGNKAFNGAEDVCRHWENATDWVKAVGLAQDACVGRFGSAELFTHLAKSCQTMPDVDWLKVIEDCRRNHHKEYKLETIRPPFFRHISLEAANYPNFERLKKNKKNPKKNQGNTSRPPYELDVVLDTNRLPTDPHSVNIELFEGNRFQRMRIPFVGKRFMQEIALGKEGGVDAPRRHKLFAQKLGVKHLGDLNPVAAIKGARLIRDGLWNNTEIPRYLLNVSVEMQAPEVNRKDFLNPTIGTRYFAVDLGIRDVAAYAVWEIVAPIDHPGPFLWHGKELFRRLKGEKEEKAIWVKLIGSGSILDEQIASEGDSPLNRFDKSLDSPVSPEEIALWDRWKAAGIIDDNKTMPEKLSLFNNQLAFCLQKFVRRLVRGVKDVLGNIGKDLLQTKVADQLVSHARAALADAFNQVFSRRKDGLRRNKAGGMSYARIDTFINLKSTCQTFIDWVDDSEIARYIDVLQEKINGVRTERVRVTANRIVSKAIKYEAQVICAEKLTIGPNQGAHKRMNRQISQWCPKMVIKNLEMQCPLHGFLLAQVYPGGTSMTDFATGNRSPRCSRLYLEQLVNEPRWGKYIQEYKTGKNRGKSERFEVYKQAWLQLVKDLGLTTLDEIIPYARMHPRERHWIPNFCGESILTASSPHGIDADRNAARNIGLRGISNLAQFAAEGSGGKKPRRHNPSPKVRARKKKG